MPYRPDNYPRRLLAHMARTGDRVEDYHDRPEKGHYSTVAGYYLSNGWRVSKVTVEQLEQQGYLVRSRSGSSLTITDSGREYAIPRPQQTPR